MTTLIHLDEVDSTMDEAHRRAEAGAADGTAILAARQRQGRGRLGRAWVAERGGIWLSVIHRAPDPELLEPLSPRLGLAVAVALESALPGLPRLQLKWPNDLLTGRRKVAGVLVETRWRGPTCEWVIVGLGVNLANPIPASLVAQATTVASITAVPSAADLAPSLVAAIRGALARGDPLDAAELVAWSARDALQGRSIDAPVPGVAEGITPAGSLRVRQADGRIVEVRTGEVAAGG
jgi:BirA family biotin operon repressor/biotin-[acetyl-CoA-carboxylase] ligase